MPDTLTRVVIPEPQTGYELNPKRGYFSVVLPEERTNLVTNPSFETFTTGYSAVTSAVLLRDSSQQRRGVYSLKVTPSTGVDSGVQYSVTGLLAATRYAFSVDILGVGGVPYRLTMLSGTGGIVAQKSFIGLGEWRRVWLVGTTTGAGTHTFRLQKDGGANAMPFWTDGWQVEAGGWPTTYLDGDQVGYVKGQVAYYWNGTAHASTSTRISQTRAGGREMKLKDMGFRVLAIIGLGMAPLRNISQPTPLIGGALYERTVVDPRTFTLAGVIDGSSLAQVQRQRAELIDCFKIDRVSPQQPLLLKYQYTDDWGNEQGDPLLIPCVYEGGLQGQTDNLNQERLGLQFTAYDTGISADGNIGTTLSYQTSVSNVNYIVQISSSGLLNLFSGGTNGYVAALAIGLDGALYVGGNFTLAGGVANTAYIAKWNPTTSTWSALGTGMNQRVLALAIGPDGSLYAGGLFTLAGGVANTAYIAKWNGSAWSALGTGMNQYVGALTFGPDGSLYAGGLFTLAGGVANTAYIAKWNGSAWSALGTGMNQEVNALVFSADGSLYAGGSFTLAGGVANTVDIAKWNGSAWSALGTGMNSLGVNALVFSADGSLYAGGIFTSAGGVANTVRIAKWNGSAWSALGTGVNSAIYTLLFLSDGRLIAGGTFSTAGGITPVDHIAIWNGSSWQYFNGIDFPGVATIKTIIVRSSKELIIGFDTSGTATVESVTTITPPGKRQVYPKFTFTGPGTMYQVANYTTGKYIYFNLTLNAGETATLDLTPGAVSFVSTFRGNILGTILPGSDLTTFSLLPGTNSISVFIAGTTTAATTVTLQYKKAHWGIDSVMAMN